MVLFDAVIGSSEALLTVLCRLLRSCSELGGDTTGASAYDAGLLPQHGSKPLSEGGKSDQACERRVSQVFTLLFCSISQFLTWLSLAREHYKVSEGGRSGHACERVSQLYTHLFWSSLLRYEPFRSGLIERGDTDTTSARPAAATSDRRTAQSCGVLGDFSAWL
jgi:hypothetical protein